MNRLPRTSSQRRRRRTLAWVRNGVLRELSAVEWRTPTEVRRRLGLAGFESYRVALVLERLVVDGLAEIEKPGSKVRRFRKARR